MSIQLPTTRLGFHYFPDFVHYRQADLHAWLPELKKLGAGWLTLLASPERAIPEFFIKALLEAGIQPVLHFQLSLHQPVDAQGLSLLFSNYAHWGVRFVALFDRPNSRQSWPATAWTRANLVERFLDIYLPLAEQALKAGLYPVFPPLEPGGDYWDTAFLQAALQGMRRRGYHSLLDRLVLGAYAWTGNLPLDWGAGGPERWPGARPYKHSPLIQDQRGFRIFDWYIAISQAVLGKPAPVIVLRAGSLVGDHNQPEAPIIDSQAFTRVNLSIAQLAAAGASATPEVAGLEPLPKQVFACNLWLLAASPLSPVREQAWYQPDGGHMQVVDLLARWQASLVAGGAGLSDPNSLDGLQPIDHYLLLPSYEWGVADWHLEAIRPFVKKYKPTIGFSVEHARQARRVTMVGEYGTFPEHVADQLIQSGCVVVQIRGTGTDLVTQLEAL